MNGHLKTLLMGVVWFALGSAATRYYDTRQPAPAHNVENAKAPADHASRENDIYAEINFSTVPLWAYGFEKPPAPGERAQPQAPPTRNLRPNENPEEQTKPRRLQGSNAEYSLVDIRDGQNVIDWFPDDHPPMPNVVQHGPV